MRITLHGAAGEVTGSSYLVETSRARVLVDFGMFQGGAQADHRNVLPPGLEPARLDGVLVTHAHLDHTGRLPLLLQSGFTGRFFATRATVELAGLILRDSAKVQSYDVERANRKRERAGKPLLKPLYTAEEVEGTLERFQVVDFDARLDVADGLQARYVGAGHMLGSASIELTARDGDAERVVVFSGDIGPSGLAIVPDAQPLRRADAVFLESTYGDRDHKPLGQTLEEFRSIIEHAVRHKSRILVPAFAVGRTQQILHHLDELFCSGAVKPFPVYLDSPMAIEATRIYQSFPDLFDQETRDMRRACEIASRHGHVKPTPTAQDSMALNEASGPCLIMAGAGMCNAGRILHHFRHGLWRPETLVVFVGFQGQGTLGRQLVDGAKEVKIFGQPVAVAAQIHTLNGFSAHAGQSELLGWMRFLAASKPQVVLTHGEPRGRDPLARLLLERHGLPAILPSQGDTVEV